MSKTKIGIVGCGWFGNFHLDNLLKRQDVEVVALVNGGDDALQKTGQKVTAAGLFHSYEEMLEQQSDLDALIVCVQPHRHGNLERDAAARGIHLYVEKPISNDLSQARANLAHIESSGIICSVGYQERYANGIEESKNALGNSAPGYLFGSWMGGAPGVSWWRDKAKSGGQIVEQCTHIVDLMRYFAGEAEQVFTLPGSNYQPSAADFTAESSSAASILFQNGAVANLATACFFGKKAVDAVGLRVFAPELQLEYSFNRGIRCFDKEQSQQYDFTGDHHARALDAFIKAVQLSDASLIRSTYRDALESLRLTIALQLSIEEKRPVLVSEV
jgi:predicted dehydrogenase